MDTTAPSQKWRVKQESNFPRKQRFYTPTHHIPEVTLLKHTPPFTCAEPSRAPCVVSKEKKVFVESKPLRGMEGVTLVSTYRRPVLPMDCNRNLEVTAADL